MSATRPFSLRRIAAIAVVLVVAPIGSAVAQSYPHGAWIPKTTGLPGCRATRVCVKWGPAPRGSDSRTLSGSCVKSEIRRVCGRGPVIH